MDRKFEVGAKVRVTNTYENFPSLADGARLSALECNGVRGVITSAIAGELCPYDADFRFVLINCVRYCIDVEGLEVYIPPPRPVVTAWRGGDNPVPGKAVDIWVDGGYQYSNQCSELIRWNHTGGFDILYYKVVDQC